MTLDGLDPAPRLNIEVALNQTYDWIWSVVCRRFTPILKRGAGANSQNAKYKVLQPGSNNGTSGPQEVPLEGSAAH